jgi:hypothetical protein
VRRKEECRASYRGPGALALRRIVRARLLLLFQ